METENDKSYDLAPTLALSWMEVQRLVESWLPQPSGCVESRHLQTVSRRIIEEVVWSCWNYSGRAPQPFDVIQSLSEYAKVDNSALSALTDTGSPASQNHFAQPRDGTTCWAFVSSEKALAIEQVFMLLKQPTTD